MRALFKSNKADAVPIPHPIRAEVPKLFGADLTSRYHGRRIAGDFYDLIRVSPNRVLFIFLDVAGGLRETRAIVSSAQQIFRNTGAELLAQREINTADAMMELCLQLNQGVLKAADGVRSCPAFGGCYDETLGVVCYFNAGHTPGLLRDHAEVRELPATGLPLGLFSHMLCDASIVALEPDAALLLVSRGLIEGKCKGEEFGLQRVKEFLQRSHAANAKELCASVLNQVEHFMHATPGHDDMTALALSRGSVQP
jgi:serine phosphatase RsbU (regulator of sigma subunit)